MILAHGTMKMTISQEDVMQAVEFWMNEKVLKNPGKVTELHGKYSGAGDGWEFSVTYLEGIDTLSKAVANDPA